MSSCCKTRSLDRHIYQRGKKVFYPQNVQKVCHAAENIVCYYHNGIEDIFGNYPVKKFHEELSADNVTRITNLTDDDMSKIQMSLNQRCTVSSTNDPNYLLTRYVDFVMATDKLLLGINSKLTQTITCGLIRYCVSLADYCTSDINFLVNYEKIIQRNAPEIAREVKDIRKQYRHFKEMTDTTKNILNHSKSVLDYVDQIRASINKLYYLVTEWVDEEHNYPSNLSDTMKLVKSQIFTIQQRNITIRDSIIVRQAKLTSLEKHIDILHKNQLILRRKQRRIRHSRQQIDIMIKNLQDHNEVEPRKKTDKCKATKIDKKIVEDDSGQTAGQRKQWHFEDNKMALDRHRERLTKIDGDIGEKIEIGEREISLCESSRDRLLTSLKEDNEIQVKDLEKLKELYPIMEDLNFVYSRKNSPETLRQLHNHGRLIVPTKEMNCVDKLCEIVAKSVADSWRELYLNLPFFPSRSKDKRTNDIEVIDLVSARNHCNDTKQAQMSLNKWRLFYHNATPQHLIEGLKKSNLLNIAKEIEELDAKSKQRYIEE